MTDEILRSRAASPTLNTLVSHVHLYFKWEYGILIFSIRLSRLDGGIVAVVTALRSRGNIE